MSVENRAAMPQKVLPWAAGSMMAPRPLKMLAPRADAKIPTAFIIKLHARAHPCH
jgi:hypothetical protein